MALTQRQRTTLYFKRGFARFRRNRGSRCIACGRTKTEADLQWAHRRPTGLNGKGRGRKERFDDIRKHPRAYALLCIRCHTDFDRGKLLRASRLGGWRCVFVPRESYR